MLAKTLGARLLGASAFTASDSGLPATVLEEVAAAITSAEQGLRGLNPSVFSVPVSMMLMAPRTGTADITAAGVLSTVSLSLRADSLGPGSGCTIAVGGESVYHRLDKQVGLSSWNLERPLDGGANVTGVTCTVWHDCWLLGGGPAGSVSYERVLGELRANREKIDAFESREEALAAQRLGHLSYGSYVADRPLNPVAGVVDSTWSEWWDGTADQAPQVRVSFYPMPSAATLVETRAVRRSAEYTSTDVGSGGTRVISAPGGCEEVFLAALAWEAWLNSSWFKPDNYRVRQIEKAAQRVRDEFPGWRPGMSGT